MLTAFSEDLYIDLRVALLERLHDKEQLIRSHAVVALSKLAGSEEPDEAAREGSIMNSLLNSLCSDPAA